MLATVIRPRDVPLGGLRAMTVRRTLPARGRSTIGAWCFVDHYGPGDVARTGGMVVPPHPHTQLQTVSWLFAGAIEHRDSAGHRATVVPGELNLMTAGRGISHSEVSHEDCAVLHGAQLWVALPEHERLVEPGFEHYVPQVLSLTGGAQVRVFLGSLLGRQSPVTTYTPLLGAEIVLEPGACLELPVDPTFEHGVLLDHGDLRVMEATITERAGLVPGDLLALDAAADSLRLWTSGGARMLLLGGPPFEESLVMWWNFLGRSHEEVAQARADWQRLLAGEPQQHAGFRLPPGDPNQPLPAPKMPPVRLRAR